MFLSRILSCLLFFFCCAAALPAQQKTETSIAAPTGFVNDFAHVLPQDEQQALEHKLQHFTQISGVEIAVVVLPKFLVEGTIEDNAQHLFEQWGFGSKQKDTGVLLLISMQERKIRIEVGYGIEPYLTDSMAGMIVRDVIAPEMRQGRISVAIEKGIEAIITTLSKDQEELFSPRPQIKSYEEQEISDLRFFAWMMVVFCMFMLRFPALRANGQKRLWLRSPVLFLLFFLLLNLLFGNIVLNALLSALAYLFQNNSNGPFSGGGPHRRSSNIFWGGGFGRGGNGGGGFGGFGGGRSGGGGASGGW